MPRRGGRGGSARRDAIVAIGLAVALLALLIAARADGGRTGGSEAHGPQPATRASGDASPPLSAPLPRGWHELDRPITGVLVPVQVYAAATYPIAFPGRPAGCGPPQAMLAEMPAGGILLQVVEYPPRAAEGRPLRVPRLPRRPDRFRWADATWASYECAGPSYQFTYRQAGRALQAQVWMHRRTVDPRLRAGALRILDNLR